MAPERIFADRTDAGQALAALLAEHRQADAVVLGVPRGGVPVAAEVARTLGLPLDVVIVRKLGAPGNPEVAMGAIGESGVRVFDPEMAERAGAGDEAVRLIEDRERRELAARVRRFRGDRERLDLRNRTAFVVDDGVATGASLRAACRAARALGAGRVVAAVPVKPASFTAADAAADELVSVLDPADLWAVGAYYRDFTQTSDDEVRAALERIRQRGAEAGP